MNNLKTLKESLSLLDLSDKTIGYTSGCFDIITSGHCDILFKCKQRCDILIVGLNSDKSIKLNKGEYRPIVNELERYFVLSSLRMIDFVFLFDDKNNNDIIKELKPDIYFKGGDYKKENLSSAPIVESYGGKVEIISLYHKTSTTRIIEKIKNTPSIKSATKQKAILIDRDGTINEEIEYLHEPEKFKLLDNASEGLYLFQKHGYKIVIITCQNGIGLGYFSKEDFFRVNREMFRQLNKKGIKVDKIYFCDSSYSNNDINPKKSLVDRAIEELNLDESKCLLIGDKTGDLDLNEKMLKIAVETGHACKDGQYDVQIDCFAKDLKNAALKVINKHVKW